MSRFMKLIRMIILYPSRLFNRISFRAMVVDSIVHKTSAIEHDTNIRYSKIGKYSYVSARSSVIHATIGNFCSVASGVAIGGGAHNIDAVSTSPIFSAGRNIFRQNFGSNRFEPFQETIIGNDVWIGNRSLVLQGVKIGDGAIIGAGSVVTKNVEPYTIVAGNPARVIRKRFDEDTISKLQKTQWWDLEDKDLKRYGDCFDTPEHFLDSYVER